MEHGLSVVTPGQDRGKKYAEWDAERKGTSWKAKLKTVLDDTIPKAKDFDDFLRLMEAAGYEIKRGKNGGKLPDFITLHMGYKELTEKKGKLYQAYGKLKKKVKQYDTIKQNVDSILRQAKQPERERQTESR